VKKVIEFEYSNALLATLVIPPIFRIKSGMEKCRFYCIIKTKIMCEIDVNLMQNIF